MKEGGEIDLTILSMMNRTILTLLTLLFLFSCKTKEIPVFIEKEIVKETIVTDTIVETKLEPQFKEQETETDSSFISNAIAYSTAKWSNGKMYHSLGIYPNSLFINTIKITETVTKKEPVPYKVEVPVEVEKKLTLLQRLKMRIGEIAIVFILFYGIYKRIKK